MKKVFLIISREYVSRVKKKSFILVTLLVPLLIVGVYGLIFWMAVKGFSDEKKITVIDESGIFKGQLESRSGASFTFSDNTLKQEKAKLKGDKNGYLLYIDDIEGMEKPKIELFSEKQAGMSLIDDINDQLEEVYNNHNLIAAGIDTSVLNNLSNSLSINSKILTEEGEKDSSMGAAYGIGIASSILIYMFIFIYGVQVMRGVIEEKTSRIVEVIVSSVKPFQLMLGKIVGIALVGLTQLLLWVMLSAVAFSVISVIFIDKGLDVEQVSQAAAATQAASAGAKANVAQDIFQALSTVNVPLILGCFIFYFLGGYFFYSALFAAVGSAVDSETETQQFMFPVTIPLLFAYMSSFVLINTPDSPFLFWLSMIPFTSPICMLVRIPFGVPTWQIILSMALMVGGFIFTVWIAGRIYRTGILMYGKKPSFKEIGKWLFYKG